MIEKRKQQDMHPLRRARLQQGLSMRELHRVSGVNHATISSIENRQRGGTVATYRKLAKALGTDYRLLMEN